MPRLLAHLLLAALALALPARAEQPDELFQVSTIDALMVGLYDGVTTIGDLRRHGDFGIGTVDRLDGELLALDGRFYQVTSDGRVHEVADAATTPFATLSFFRPERRVAIADAGMKTTGERIDAELDGTNLPQAVRIEGTFRHVRTRSVPRQSPPYAPLGEVAAKQSVFEFHDVRGVMVGYRLPAYFARVNVPGYHLHFLTEDRSAGGHVLDFEAAEVTAMLDELAGFRMVLPTGTGFRRADLAPDRDKELRKIER